MSYSPGATGGRLTSAPRPAVAALLAAMLLTACVAPPQRAPGPGAEGRDTNRVAGPEPAAPARPPQQPGSVLGTPGNPPFYDVLGERYHVLENSAGYLERGVASWYGREFHGKRTSSGEVYDMYDLTAAHKTLPLPTTARVTNLANGKSVVVRINDRGPFKDDRLIDMSYAAARELGMLGPGTALVEVEALPQHASGAGPVVGDAAPDLPQKAPAQPREAAAMYVQVGAFGQVANAEELKQRLQQLGFADVVIRYDPASQPALYRVRIGPIADSREFDAVVRRVSAMQIRNPQLVVERTGIGPRATGSEAVGPPGG